MRQTIRSGNSTKAKAAGGAAEGRGSISRDGRGQVGSEDVSFSDVARFGLLLALLVTR